MNSFLQIVAVMAEPTLDHGWPKPIAVTVALIVLYKGIRWIRAKVEARPRVTSGAEPIVPHVSAGSGETISPEIIAIITAAVHVALGVDVRIAKIASTLVVPSSAEVSMQQWSIEGRRQIYSSHQFR